MKFIALSVTSTLLLGLSSAAAVPASGFTQRSELPALSAVQKFEAVEWKFDTENGPLFFKGTVEQVHAQIEKEHPDLLDELFEPPTSPNEKRDVDLFKRTDFSGASWNCNHWREAAWLRVREGIDYLGRVQGQPTRGPGPSSCGRVSCSNHAAINWCNDTRQQKTLSSFGSIADGAQHIVNICTRGSPDGYYGYGVAGQAFHPTGWNVIVGYDSC